MRNVNRNLHRPSVMPDDEASAPEGGIPHGHWRENQGRPILPTPRPLKPIESVEEELPWMWALYCVVIVVTIAACSVAAGYA